MNIIPESRWAIQVIGSHYDVLNLAYKLNKSIMDTDDYCLRMIGDCWCLQTARWNTLDLVKVRSLAASEIAVLRGCLEILDTCGVLKVGTVFELEEGRVKSRSRVTELNVVVLPKYDDRAEPRVFKRFLKGADMDDALKIAVREFRSLPGWSEIYKALEAALKLWNGINHYRKTASIHGNLLNKIMETADWHRHASVRRPYPKNPVTLSDAQHETRTFLRATFERFAPRDLPMTDTAHQVQIPRPIQAGECLTLSRRTFENGRTSATAMVGEPVNWPTFDWPDSD